MSTEEIRDEVKDIAEEYIRDNASERDYGSIGEYLESKGFVDKLPQSEFDDLQEAVYDAIGRAEIDIHFPYEAK